MFVWIRTNSSGNRLDVINVAVEDFYGINIFKHESCHENVSI